MLVGYCQDGTWTGGVLKSGFWPLALALGSSLLAANTLQSNWAVPHQEQTNAVGLSINSNSLKRGFEIKR
jgi:hypothetical protein